MNNKEAIEVFETVIAILKEKHGFTEWWYAIDDTTKLEISIDIVNAIKKQHNGI